MTKLSVENQYMFFDIECCNGWNMCSFGYVVVNEKFEILAKEEILINPEAKFKLSRAGFDPNVKLAHPQEVFLRAPTFAQVYDEIAKQFTLFKNRKFFGHSVHMDKKYLYIACRDYNKSKLNFIAYDTQVMYKKFKSRKNQNSIETIARELNLDLTQLTPHKSCDDAEISMLTLKAICEYKHCSIEKYLSEYKVV